MIPLKRYNRFQAFNSALLILSTYPEKMIQNTKMNLQRHFTKAGNASINTYIIILKNTTRQTLRVPPGGGGRRLKPTLHRQPTSGHTEENGIQTHLSRLDHEGLFFPLLFHISELPEIRRYRFCNLKRKNRNLILRKKKT